jgi:hypothetical protein
VTWTLNAAEDLKYVGIDQQCVLPSPDRCSPPVHHRYTLESGEFRVAVGHDIDCRATPSQPLCASFTLQVDKKATKSKSSDDSKSYSLTQISVASVVTGVVGIVIGMLLTKAHSLYTRPRDDEIYQKIHQSDTFASSGYAPPIIESTRESEI